jgi:hypothetical protein
MRVDQLAREIGARIISSEAYASEVDRAYAGNRISDLLNHAGERTLLVTGLSGAQVLRVADLMNVPAICFLDAADPDPDMLTLAAVNSIAILVSTLDMAETCARLRRCLKEVEAAG